MSDHADNVTRLFPERKKASFRIVALILAFLIVIGSIVVVLSLESGHFDALRRFFTYLGTNEEEPYFTYLPNSGSVFSMVDEELATASVSDFAVYGTGGELIGRVQVPFVSPAILAGDEVAMAYDIGGKVLTAMDRRNQNQLNLDLDGTLLDADISAADRICYAMSTNSYKTVLVAMNEDFQETYRWYSSSSYLTNCAISPKGDWMAAISIGENEHSYDSRLLIFDTSSEEAPTETSLGNQLVYDLEINRKGQICVISDTGATLLDRNGDLYAEYRVENRYLSDFDFGGDDFLTLAMNMYKAGNHYALVTMSMDGGEAYEVEIDQEIVDLDACGGYVGVLTTDGLIVYRKDLTEYARMEQTGAASGILMRDDGTVLLLGSDSAQLFIP